MSPDETEIVRRLVDGEDPWVIDPEYGCTNPLTGYFPSAEVAAERVRLAARSGADTKLLTMLGAGMQALRDAVATQFQGEPGMRAWENANRAIWAFDREFLSGADRPEGSQT